jgi:hypothetical protein
MSSESKSSVNIGSGIGTFGLLGIIFVILKILGKITWSWWLVLLPFYGPTVVALVIALLVFLAIMFVAVVVDRKW